MSIQISIVEGEEQCSGDGSLQTLNIQLPNLFHFEADIAGQVIKRSIAFLLFKHFVSGEFKLILNFFLHLDESWLHKLQ